MDLLNRLSATDLSDTHQPTPALLTDERGRIASTFTVLTESSQKSTLNVYDPNPEPTINAIRKYTILEDVECEDSTPTQAHLALIGTGAQDISNQLTSSYNVIACPTFFSNTTPDRFDLLVPNEQLQAVLKQLEDAQIKLGTQQEYESLRIEHGWQKAGAELTDAYNPLEANLKHLISFTKGCYTGQEVIARLDTYDKVQRRLVHLKLSDNAETGDVIMKNGINCGVITSADSGYALGYIKVRQLGEDGQMSPLEVNAKSVTVITN